MYWVKNYKKRANSLRAHTAVEVWKRERERENGTLAIALVFVRLFLLSTLFSLYIQVQAFLLFFSTWEGEKESKWVSVSRVSPGKSLEPWPRTTLTINTRARVETSRSRRPTTHSSSSGLHIVISNITYELLFGLDTKWSMF